MTLLVALGLVGLAVAQNDYDLTERRVRLAGNGQTLDGVLATPATGRGPYGLVVFVHGDGPSDASADGFYRPMWEAFARAGYASLSWSKPGVGDSTGNWLDQSMEDRAQEVEDAITWARNRGDVDPGRIGLWGGSQAGWVMPKVAARADVKFMIAVSPAVNWRQQGRYNLTATMRDRGATPARIEEAIRRSDQLRRLVDRDAGYEQYRAELGSHADLSPDRWRFVKRNSLADATDDLRRTGTTDVVLILGGHDLNVDVSDTERTYRATVPASHLTVVHYPEATHSMVPLDLDRSTVKRVLTGIFAPRSLFVTGYLDDLRRFVRR